MPNITPPGAQTYLKKSEEERVKSALLELYEAVMLDYSEGDQLTEFSRDIGFERPPVFFSDDDQWRAIVRAAAFGTKHTRDGVRRVFELILGPIVSQATVLDRTTYATVTVGATLTITGSTLGSNGTTGTPKTYTVTQVRMHELVFAAGTFNKDDTAVNYSIVGTASTVGELLSDSDGNDILRDTTVQFINTHPDDFLSKTNSKIPQYGKVFFNRASPSDEENFTMSFYDKSDTGILKIRERKNDPRKFTRNKYMPIQSSFLSSDVDAKSKTVSILDASNFPANAVPAPAVTHGSDVLVIKSPASVAGTYAISAVSSGTLTIAAIAGVTSPVTDVTYSINVDGALELKGTNVAGTMFGLQTGKVENATTFSDSTKDFSENINASRYSVTINRGEATEETVEVVSRSGAVLTLASNADIFPAGTESRLKYKHFKGESIEIANLTYSTTGSHYVLDASGNVEGTADTSAVDGTTLVDAAATFVLANESSIGGAAGTVVDGDEVEITDTSSALLGQRRAIKSVNVGTDTLTLSPGFGSAVTGLKYKIRKKYKPTATASKDSKIYVEDARGFPSANFSVILDRGKKNEEVVWVSTNTMFSGTNVGVFTVANNTETTPTAFVSKEHDFGMTVEPAQILIESCPWTIIETQANGEFTVAFDEDCAPAMNPKHMYLHEKIDSTKFTNATGTEVIQATTTDSTVSSTSTQVRMSLDHLDANLRDAASESPQDIYRSVKIVSGSDASVTDNLFLTSELTFTRLVNRSGTAVVAGNYPFEAGKDFDQTDMIAVEDVSNFTIPPTIVVDGEAVPDMDSAQEIIISKIGAPDSEEETVKIVSIFSTLNPPLIKVTPSLSKKHFVGDSVQATTARVGIASAGNIASGTTYPVGSKISLLYNEDEFSHPTDLLGPNNTVSVQPDLLSTTVLVDHGRTFHPSLIGHVLVMTSGSNIGEERVITEVRGSGNHQLVVGTAFSNAIAAGDKYKIKTLLQSGDVNSLDSNLAYKPWYAGPYIYAHQDDLNTGVDQASSTNTALPDKNDETGNLADGTSRATAVFRIPAPQKLIATPKLSQSQTLAVGNELVASPGINLEAIAAVGDEIEFLGPNTDPNYKQRTKVVEIINPFTVKVSPLDHDTTLNSYYRLHGSPVDANGEPAIALSAGASAPVYLYIDDATLFPLGEQNPFTITVGSGETKERFEVDNINIPEGRIELNSLETVQFDHFVGEDVALEVKHLLIQGDSIDWPSSGAFYLDYGFRGNNLCQTELNLTGTGSTGTVDGKLRLLDMQANFSSAYGVENLHALVGHTVFMDGDSATITEVLSDTILILSSGSTIDSGLATTTPYTITSSGLQSLVDNSEPGTTTTQAGGILTAVDVSNVGVDYPAGSTDNTGGNDFRVGGIRYGGAVEEYVEYSSKDGRVLTLKDTESIGHVFKHAHPSGTKIMLATGKFSTTGDGTDYRPYLGGNFLEVILNSGVTNLPDLLRAAGIQFKAEQTDLGC